jgi:hypothetical protein
VGSVWEEHISQCVSSLRSGRFGLFVFLNYPCIPSVSPDNLEYTVVPAIFSSLQKGLAMKSA